MPSPQTSRKPPKKMTRARIRNIAIAYVQRYGGSRQRLTQVLTRRAQRSLQHHGELERRGEVLDWIEAVVTELQAQGLSDDLRHARAYALDLSLQGRSQRAIRHALRRKGFDNEASEAAIAAIADPELDTDWIACCRYARRRGLGPFAAGRTRARTREQQLASLVRAGFTFQQACRVLDEPDADALEQVILDARTPTLTG